MSKYIQDSTNKDSLISTRPFNEEFYTYTTSTNSKFQIVGTFTLVINATEANCPGSRVLHLTGRKLYPNVNPMTNFVRNAPLQSAKFLVSVYDPVSSLSGFIDPTSATFAKFDQKISNFFDQGASGAALPSLGGQGARLAVADYGVRQTATFTSTNINLNQVTINAGNATCGIIVLNNTASPYSAGGIIVVNTTAAIAQTATTTGSRIFLQVTANPVTSLVGIPNTSNGSFVIGVGTITPDTGNPIAQATLTSSQGTIINWLVVN